jgi:hypothetical protein
VITVLLQLFALLRMRIIFLRLGHAHLRHHIAHRGVVRTAGVLEEQYVRSKKTTFSLTTPNVAPLEIHVSRLEA